MPHELLAILLVLTGLPAGWLVNRLANSFIAAARERGAAEMPPEAESARGYSTLDLSKLPRLARFRPPLVIIGLALGFGLLAYGYGWEWRLLAGCCYLTLFCLISVVDLEERIIPNELVLAGSLLALAFSFVPGHPVPPRFAIVGAVAGFVIFGAVYLLGLGLAALTHRTNVAPVGLGDLKLSILIGLVTGFPAVMGAIFVGAFVGGAVMIALLATGRVGRRTYVPYGPFLLAGATWIYFFALRGYLS